MLIVLKLTWTELTDQVSSESGRIIGSVAAISCQTNRQWIENLGRSNKGDNEEQTITGTTRKHQDRHAEWF